MVVAVLLRVLLLCNEKLYLGDAGVVSLFFRVPYTRILVNIFLYLWACGLAHQASEKAAAFCVAVVASASLS